MQRISGWGRRVGIEDVVDYRSALTVSKVDQDVRWFVEGEVERCDRGLTR
jgi:hypothetical protein